MQAKTLDDVLTWTREFHHELSRCLRHCSNKHQEARARMLLEYLSEHERQLEKTITALHNRHAERKSLDTWIYEHSEMHPIVHPAQCEESLGKADTSAIMSAIVEQQEQMIDLYRYLLSRAVSADTQAMLQELLALEENETMRMVRDSERLEDI